MDKLALVGDERMTVKEVADALGYEYDTLRKKVKELFPDSVQNGISTYLSQEQVIVLKQHLLPRTLALKSGVESAVTDLEMRQKAAEVMMWLLKDNETLKAKNSELEPKAAFFDAVADSKTALQMRDVAAALNIEGVGRNKLFEILRQKKVLDDRNVPYRSYQDKGYFRVIEQKWADDGGEIHISLKTLVYQKGVEFIRKLVLEER
jgi:phage antirepressor YoqD-like protein